ncbi:transcriptional regulator with XRE-family HTH domain [Actinopolyspora biskrensis]|uniref:Transcriptional regulator with XRE-family HTH domain n=1 Tax=Actinopolyspora biskrensis TaxID=1470178 RepID=A0A852YQ62_9ACTN|nr:XRE family transcriptional regulator [Actinopolyspora biskrensis]NYH76881.1 transcriptional regulator with XRE-family HTH domain [Actinopolyspora biskrensis]
MSDSRAATALEVIAPALRHAREDAGISLNELAKRAGLAKSTLSQLESGAGNPSVETLWAVAATLEVPFSRLVEPPAPHVKVIRSGRAPKLGSEQGDFAAGLLSSCPAGASRDLYEITLPPEQERHAEPHHRGTIEHLVVTSGTLRAGPAAEPVELEPGDYLTFSGEVAHVYRTLSRQATALLIMEHK